MPESREKSMVVDVDVFAFNALVLVDFDVDSIVVFGLQCFFIAVDDPIFT